MSEQITPININLGVSHENFDKLVNTVIYAVTNNLSEPTPNAVKVAAIKSLLEQHKECTPEHYALIGLMVEQGYNSCLQNRGFKFPAKPKKH